MISCLGYTIHYWQTFKAFKYEYKLQLNTGLIGLPILVTEPVRWLVPPSVQIGI